MARCHEGTHRELVRQHRCRGDPLFPGRLEVLIRSPSILVVPGCCLDQQRELLQDVSNTGLFGVKQHLLLYLNVRIEQLQCAL